MRVHEADGAEKTAASSPTDTDAIHDNTAGEIAAITEKTALASADMLVIEDSDAANVKKMVQVGNLPAFDEVRLNVYNNSGVAITAGQVVYVSGYNVGQGLPEVSLADADDAAKMPAVGMADTTINNVTAGSVVASGIIEGVSTVGYAVNDPIYVGTTAGAYVNVRPTVDAIQKIGQVLQVAAGGKMLVVGAGRSNDVPIAPSFTDYTNANHDHSDASSGGTLAAAAVPDGADATAIHDNVASEISAIGEKVAPVGADMLVIEDSEDTNAKKMLQMSNLPAGAPADNSITNAKLADINQNIIKGRITAAAGDPEDLTAANVLTIIGVTAGADPTAANETTHADVVQDGDFGSDGYLQRSGGAGAYAVQATPIPTADTAAKCTDATADNTAGNETTHSDVLQDGDFSANGYMKRTGAGAYSVQAIPIPETDGGTGQTTITAGDVLYGDGANSLGKLAKGTAFQHLRMNSGATAPEWATRTQEKAITIETPADGDRLVLWMNEAAITVLGVSFSSAAGTSVLFNIEHAVTIASGTVIHTDTCATSTPEWSVTPSGASAVATNQIIMAEITTVTGVVTQLHITVHYRENV